MNNNIKIGITCTFSALVGAGITAIISKYIYDKKLTKAAKEMKDRYSASTAYENYKKIASSDKVIIKESTNGELIASVYANGIAVEHIPKNINPVFRSHPKIFVSDENEVIVTKAWVNPNEPNYTLEIPFDQYFVDQRNENESIKDGENADDISHNTCDKDVVSEAKTISERHVPIDYTSYSQNDVVTNPRIKVPPVPDIPKIVNEAIRSITPEEFGENEDYEKITLTKYADNKVVEWGTSMPIDVSTLTDILGNDAFDKIGEYEDDVAYICNDNHKTYYELLVDIRPYSEVLNEKLRVGGDTDDE